MALASSHFETRVVARASRRSHTSTSGASLLSCRGNTSTAAIFRIIKKTTESCSSLTPHGIAGSSRKSRRISRWILAGEPTAENIRSTWRSLCQITSIWSACRSWMKKARSLFQKLLAPLRANRPIESTKRCCEWAAFGRMSLSIIFFAATRVFGRKSCTFCKIQFEQG